MRSVPTVRGKLHLAEHRSACSEVAGQQEADYWRAALRPTPLPSGCAYTFGRGVRRDRSGITDSLISSTSSQPAASSRKTNPFTQTAQRAEIAEEAKLTPCGPCTPPTRTASAGRGAEPCINSALTTDAILSTLSTLSATVHHGGWLIPGPCRRG